ncbi:mitochondrial ribosomal small subunit component [Coemansia sp. Benny D160-2]|nr:mitochondrial ribosomal small subunit component [Coemansia sp. Benny D160-2]
MPSHFSTRGKLDFEGKDVAAESGQIDSAARIKVERKLPQGCVTLRHKKLVLRTRNARPPKIVFPEDELRREFYKNHPFEKFRPRIVMETNGKNNQDWGRLSNGASLVTGESVVRYQHYLMQAEGMSKQDAYTQATNEFYKVRAREEMENKIARQEAVFYGARMLEKPFSTSQAKVERSQMSRNKKLFEVRQKEQHIRNVAATGKTFAAGV